MKLQEKFYSVIQATDFPRMYQSPDTKEEVIKLLECLVGVAKGSRVNTAEKLFDFLFPLCQHCVTLLGKCRGK